MSTSTLLGAVLLVAAGALLTVGALGWSGRLPRNRFAGVRTPATLRSDAAFAAANRVAAPPLIAAGGVAAVGGALALGATGSTLVVIVGVSAVGVLTLGVAGGLLGHKAAATVPVSSGCGGCACGAGGCAQAGAPGEAAG